MLKRVFLQAVAIIIMVCMFSGCGAKAPENDSGKTGNEGTKISTPQDKTGSKVEEPVVNEKTAEDYIDIKTVQTDFATLKVPKFKTDVLSSDDITMANEMFNFVEEAIMASVEKCKDNAKEMGVDVKQLSAGTLFDTKTALNGDILSVLIRYGEMAFFSEQMYYYSAVNVDVTTGKVVSYDKLLEASGFSKEDAEKSLYWYGEENNTYEWERKTYYTFGSAEELPTGLGDPSGGWQDELENVVEEFKNPSKPQGTKWDDLDIFPTVFYEGKGNLSVCGRYPVESGYGYEYVMVNVGKTAGERAYRNPTNWYGEPFVRLSIFPEDAAIAVSRALKLDDDGKTPDGVKLEIELQSTKNITSDGGESEPCYVFTAYEDLGTHTATYALMGVGIFSGNVMKNDAASDEWNVVSMDKGIDEEKLVEDAKSKKAGGVIYNKPDGYELWRVAPYGNFNVNSSEDEETGDSSKSEGLLLYVTEDSQVSLESGTMADGKFKSKSVLDQVDIPEGQCIHVVYSRGEEKDDIAVIIRNKTGDSIYELLTNGTKEKIEYPVQMQ